VNEEQSIAQQAELNCYLATMLAAANAIAAACPEVGAIYRHRLTRLRARLAFDSAPDALEESRRVVEAELKEYATEAAAYSVHHAGELRAALGALEEIVHTLVLRQDFYAARLRQFARQMELAEYPHEVREVVALQAAGLLSCVESMSHETQSQMTRMRGELADAEQRIKEAAKADPATGLMNRRELERRIEMVRASGGNPVLLHFHLTGPVTEYVTQQVAARLASQFRHKDFISRWSDTDFMVLFHGPAEIAEARAQRIVPWVAGQYVVEDGQSVQVGVEVGMPESELVA
jgi:GGDEF domain-containing protein